MKLPTYIDSLALQLMRCPTRGGYVFSEQTVYPLLEEFATEHPHYPFYDSKENDEFDKDDSDDEFIDDQRSFASAHQDLVDKLEEIPEDIGKPHSFMKDFTRLAIHDLQYVQISLHLAPNFKHWNELIRTHPNTTSLLYLLDEKNSLTTRANECVFRARYRHSEGEFHHHGFIGLMREEIVKAMETDPGIWNGLTPDNQEAIVQIGLYSK